MKNLVKGEIVYPGIVSYKNVVLDCKKIISKSLDEFKIEDARVGSFSEVNDSIRKNDVIELLPSYKNDIYWFSLAKLIWSYGDRYADDHQTEFSNMETPQLLRYKEKKDFYISHTDSSARNPRIFSCLLYLNDVELGGETHFDKIDLSIKPEAGKLIFFPANYIYSHEARSPEIGEKFVVVTWFNP